MNEGHPGSTPGFDPDAGVSAPQLSGFSTRDGGGGVRPSAEFAVPEDHRYRSPQLLGIGGMGRVVAVHDRRLRRDVALKVPHPDTPLAAGLDSRLAREAQSRPDSITRESFRSSTPARNNACFWTI